MPEQAGELTVATKAAALFLGLMLGPLTVQAGLGGLPHSAIDWRLVVTGFVGSILWGVFLFEVVGLV